MRKFIHRDIKPANILCTKSHKKDLYNIKLTDFGFACYATERDAVTESFGSVAYMAPERLTFGSKYGKKSDIWSLGVLLYILIAKELPFSGEDI